MLSSTCRATDQRPNCVGLLTTACVEMGGGGLNFFFQAGVSEGWGLRTDTYLWKTEGSSLWTENFQIWELVNWKFPNWFGACEPPPGGELTYESDVRKPCHQASTRAFLSRNISHCSQKVKEAAYYNTTFIRPTVEYASSAWDTHTQRNTKKLEQIQRSSARFVTKDYDRISSVSAMLQALNWTSLQDRRMFSRLHMLYKIRFGLVDIPWEQHLTPLSSSTRGHSLRFLVPHTNITAYSNSFFPRTTREWNVLPVNPADYQTLDAFKDVLRVCHQK